MGGFRPNIHLWPRGVIPYEPNPNHEFWDIIQSAIIELNYKTNLIFREKRSTDLGWIFFTCDKTKGNFVAGLGCYRGGIQVNVKHNVRALHELGHVVGMIHEHQRSDRDEYIEIREDNFDPREGGTKDAILEKEDFVCGTPYDITSCMHYWCTAHFKRNFLMNLFFEDRTMIYKPDTKLRFMTPEVLSTLDIECINNAYKEEVAKRVIKNYKSLIEENKDNSNMTEGLTELYVASENDPILLASKNVIKLNNTYLCYTKENSSKCIRSLLIISTSKKEEFSRRSHSYSPVLTPDGDIANLNQGSEGNYISLWFSCEEFLGLPIKDFLVKEGDQEKIEETGYTKLSANLSKGIPGKYTYIFYK